MFMTQSAWLIKSKVYPRLLPPFNLSSLSDSSFTIVLISTFSNLFFRRRFARNHSVDAPPKLPQFSVSNSPTQSTTEVSPYWHTMQW
jgi:hypothetical protein